jgi:3-oxoacyl-(acyl-carrier-protein) synthase
VFGTRPPAVTAVKGALGESGASTSASIAAAILCGQRGIVPPVAGLRHVDPACAHLPFATSAVPLRGPIALLNGVASGGALATAILRVNA